MGGAEDERTNHCVIVYGSFFLTTTGPDGCESPVLPISLWIPQIGVGVGMTVWNILALESDFSIDSAPKSGATTYCWAVALIYAVTFGSTLMISPAIWGP